MILSIIIPVYNTAAYLQKCIESCLKQNVAYDVYEIIIINDGSTDDSLCLINKIVSEYDGVIRVFSQGNRGLSEARNLGLKYAQGTYVWFVDSDDWISHNCLADVLDAIQLYNPDILRFQSRKVDDLEKELGDILINQAYNIEIVSGKNLLSSIEFNVSATAYLVKRSIIFKYHLSFLPGVYHEDMAFTPQLYLSTTNILLYNKVLYYIRETPSSITRSFRFKKSTDLLLVGKALYIAQNKGNDSVNSEYYYWISLCITSAINNLVDSPSSDYSKFKSTFINNAIKYKYLFSCLDKSRMTKYRVLKWLIDLGGLNFTIDLFRLRIFLKSLIS